MILALKLAIDLKNDYSNLLVCIFANNQSVSRTATNSHTYMCQFFFDKILRLHQQLGRLLIIHWIPAYIGIPCNETADTKAKSTVKSVSFVQPAPTGPFIITPTLANFKTSFLKYYGQRWAFYPHRRYIYWLQPIGNCNPLLKYNGLKRAVFSLIIQIQTGKIAPNKVYLLVDQSNTDRCTLCQPRRGPVQSVAHIFFEGTKFNRLKKDIL